MLPRHLKSRCCPSISRDGARHQPAAAAAGESGEGADVREELAEEAGATVREKHRKATHQRTEQQQQQTLRLLLKPFLLSSHLVGRVAPVFNILITYNII